MGKVWKLWVSDQCSIYPYVLGVLYRQFKVFLKIGISSAFGKKEGERESASVNRSGKLPRNCRSGNLPRNCHFNVSSAFERRRTLTFTFGERVWTRVRWKKFLQLAVLVTLCQHGSYSR